MTQKETYADKLQQIQGYLKANPKLQYPVRFNKPYLKRDNRGLPAPAPLPNFPLDKECQL